MALPPPRGWSKCPQPDDDGIRLYNTLVNEWNTWAKDDPHENAQNWRRLPECLDSEEENNGRRAILTKEVRRIATGNRNDQVCWGHAVLGSMLFSHASTQRQREKVKTLSALQRWYPDSDIMASGRYNEYGPSFTPHFYLDLRPVRCIVQQGNTNGSNGHQQNNTPQQDNTPQENNQSAP
jgi:hypothetical protein